MQVVMILNPYSTASSLGNPMRTDVASPSATVVSASLVLCVVAPQVTHTHTHLLAALAK